jgi:voltage-gated potassium channel
VTAASGRTPAKRTARRLGLRRRIFEILEHGAAGGRASWWVGSALIGLIIVNLLAVVLGSLPDIARDYANSLAVIEYISIVVFSIEYALRLWVAVEHETGTSAHPLRARIAYATSLNGIIDLVAIVPFVLGFFLPADLRAFLVFRIFRFLKLARYSVGVRSLLDAIHEERRPLGGCVLIFAGAALVAASLMYLVEHDAQPEKFGSIPQALWWAVSTLGTTGYGDVVPITPLGKVINGLTIMCALVMIALPVGIVATAFSQNIHRRDFIVTWGMVARVPLFAGLKASEIADICRLLRTETAEAGAIVTRRGDPAHSMYFVASGGVEIELPDGEVAMGAGQFFGEIAVLRRARRSATVRAVERTRLLVLDARDFRTLVSAQPDLAQRIGDVVKQRTGHEPLTPEGDLISEEIADGEKAAPDPDSPRKPKRRPRRRRS